MKRILLMLFLAIFCAVPMANATPMKSLTIGISQYGDFDLLDENVTWSGGFDWRNLYGQEGEGVSGQEGITDTWLLEDSGVISWSQPGFEDILDNVGLAFMAIGHGGWGIFGQPTLTLFGQEIGSIHTSRCNENRYAIDFFNLSAFGDSLIGPQLDFSLLLPEGRGTDGGAIDFSTVLAVGEAANPVPEPSTILLFGAGLLGVAGVGRKRKKLS